MITTNLEQEIQLIFMTHKKVHDIPPVRSVSCGANHTMIIINELELWSCGNNSYGQLCLGHDKQVSQFQQTQYFNIVKVSLGCYFSLFQNDSGEIFSCGKNNNGELGLGHFNSPQLTPTLIPNLPSNIEDFVCGNDHNLFLGSEGNVFSVGANVFGQLGFGNKTEQNVLNQIRNIPRIKYISCVTSSSYLLDFEGNLWSFGNNENGQFGDTNERLLPIKVESIKNIQQISRGCGGNSILAKDSRNTFIMGNNIVYNTYTCSVPEKLMPFFFLMWGDIVAGKGKSARK